jgi:membrane-bound metal-dependent hydrolase YbcI (DUF457 family)
MENLTHTLVGGVLGKSGLEKVTPYGMPALLIASNLPDIDIFAGRFGFNYLDVHRGITHGVAGTVVLSAALAGAFQLWNRLKTRGTTGNVGFWPLWLLCFIGVASNPLLDALNEYGIRPWLPFNSRRYYGDLIGIADPWLWLMLISALYLAAGSRTIKVLLIGLALLAAALILFSAGWFVALIWIGTLGVASGIGRLMRRRGVNPARLALAALVLYLCGIALMRERVRTQATEVAPELIPGVVQKIDVLPGRPGAFNRWTVVVVTADKYYFAEAGAHDWRKEPPKLEEFQKNLGHPCFEKALADREIAAMFRFARYPSVSIRETSEGCTVSLRDLRYARRGGADFAVASTTIPHRSNSSR